LLLIGFVAAHAKQDSSVIKSHRFGLSASNFTNEGSGVAASNVAKYLV